MRRKVARQTLERLEDALESMSDAPGTGGSNGDVLVRFWEAYEQGSDKEYLDWYGPAATAASLYTSNTLSIPDMYTELDPVMTAFPDLKWTILNRVSSGELLVEEWVQEGTHLGTFMGVAPTGKRIRARGITVYVIRDGRIQEDRTVVDTLAILRQIGVVAEGFYPGGPDAPA
jgi:steroid delta-isomerase-like uncharacterized protein